MKFAQLGLIAPLLKAVTKAGLISPTPIQALAIPEGLVGKDVLGAAEAGTGKTAAFVLPVLQRLSQSSPARHPLSRRVRSLVITANSELAKAAASQFTAFGRYLGLNSLAVTTLQEAGPLGGPLRSVDVLITTPERLLQLQMTGGVDLRAVEVLVIDEADRMADLGLLVDVQRIISQLPLDRQTLLFTATLPSVINSLADAVLKAPSRIRIPPTRKVADQIQQSVCFVNRPQKTAMLIGWLETQPSARTVVFTRSRQGADRVVRQLLSSGVRAEAIHGEKPPAARQETLNRFRSQLPPVLVVTDLAARGIDVDSISRVVSYDLPMEPETYVHRIGRISRGVVNASAVTLCDEGERKFLKGIERLLRHEIPVDGKTQPIERGTRTPITPAQEQAIRDATPPVRATSSRRRTPASSPTRPRALTASSTPKTPRLLEATTKLPKGVVSKVRKSPDVSTVQPQEPRPTKGRVSADAQSGKPQTGISQAGISQAGISQAGKSQISKSRAATQVGGGSKASSNTATSKRSSAKLAVEPRRRSAVTAGAGTKKSKESPPRDRKDGRTTGSGKTSQTPRSRAVATRRRR